MGTDDARIRIGASIWGFFGRREAAAWPSLPDAARAILSVAPSLGIEVWGSKALHIPQVSEAENEALTEVCRGAAFVTVHVRGVYMEWNPAGLRREIDFAARVGACRLVLHPVCFGLLRPNDRSDVPEIRRVAEYAAGRGVRLALENTVDAIWILDRVLEEVGDDPEKTNLGICIDTGHAHMSHDAGREPISNYLERYAGQLVHVHVHDNRGETDEHLVPGTGTIDWPRVLRTLHAIAFDGTAVLEIHPAEGGSMPDAVRDGLAFLGSSVRGLRGCIGGPFCHGV